MVDVVKQKYESAGNYAIPLQVQREERDDVDDGDENELRHGNHVTSVGL